jgi:hypothetical protein
MEVHAIDSLFPSSKIVKEPIIVLNKITTVTRAYGCEMVSSMSCRSSLERMEATSSRFSIFT